MNLGPKPSSVKLKITTEHLCGTPGKMSQLSWPWFRDNFHSFSPMCKIWPFRKRIQTHTLVLKIFTFSLLKEIDENSELSSSSSRPVQLH